MKKKTALALSAFMLIAALTACAAQNEVQSQTTSQDTQVNTTQPTAQAASDSIGEQTQENINTQTEEGESTDSGTVKSYTDFIAADPHDDEYFSTDEDDYCYIKTSCYPSCSDQTQIFNRCTTYNLLTYNEFGVATSSKYKIVFENAADAQTAYDYYQQPIYIPLYSEGFMLFDNVVYFYDASSSPSSAVGYTTKWQLFAVFEEYEQTYFTEIEKSEDLRYYNYSGVEYYLSKPLVQEDYDKLDAYYALAEPMTGYHTNDGAYVSVNGNCGYGYENYEYSVRVDEDHYSYADIYDIVFDDKSITIFSEETEYDETYNFVPTGKTAVIRLEKTDDSIQVDAATYNERVTRETVASTPSEWQKQVFIPLSE